MKNHQLFSAILLALPVAFTACSKDGAEGPQGAQGPAGPSLTGNLKGFVQLYDQYGTRVLTDQDSVVVSTMSPPNQSYTDSLGRYTISSLQTGVYTVNCVKSGYGDNQLNSLGFTGGGDIYRDIRLSAIPDFHVDSISVTADTQAATIVGHLAPDTRGRNVIIFIGTTSAASADPATYLTYYIRVVSQNATMFQQVVPLGDLNNVGMTSGSTAYFAAYAIASSLGTSSNYEDLATGRTRFTAISPLAATQNVLIP